MEKSKKLSLLAITVVAVLVLGLAGSIALAQDATPDAPAQEDATVPESRDFLRGHGMGRWDGFGRSSSDGGRLAYLAEALGITVDELEDAQERAYAASVADAVAAGEITQEQADQILAARALKSYIDRQTILATALGMTVEELEAALTGGQTLSELMEEKGVDAATLQANAQAAYEAAVQQAVTDGVITQTQADEVLAGDEFNLFGRGGRGGHHGGGRGGRGGFHDFHGFGVPSVPDSTTPDTSEPETTDTSFDA